MKPGAFLFLIFLAVITPNVKAQNKELRSLGEVNLHFLALGISYEQKISEKMTVKGEINYETGLSYSWNHSGKYFLATASPTVSIEPRYYYNIKKRNNKGSNVSNNGYNFISLKTAYNFDFLALSNKKNVFIYNNFMIAPMWNLRRNISDSKFSYEMGVGLGAKRTYYKSFSETKIIIPVNIRIAYELF